MIGGSAVAAIRLVIGETDPMQLALLRYGIGLLCLLPLVMLSARASLRRGDWLSIAGLVLGEPVTVRLRPGLWPCLATSCSRAPHPALADTPRTRSAKAG